MFFLSLAANVYGNPLPKSALQAVSATRESSSVGTDEQYRDDALNMRMKDIERTLEHIEARLGRAVRPPTLTQNMERRLSEVEKRLDAMDRELKKVDSLERDVKRMEDRLRRVETRK